MRVVSHGANLQYRIAQEYQWDRAQTAFKWFSARLMVKL